MAIKIVNIDLMVTYGSFLNYKEFLDHHYDVDEMFPEYRRNEYGYIPNWFKYHQLNNNFM